MKLMTMIYAGAVFGTLCTQAMAAGQAKDFHAFCGANNQLYINVDHINNGAQPPIVERVLLNKHPVTCSGSAFVSHGKALNPHDLGYAALQSAGLVASGTNTLPLFDASKTGTLIKKSVEADKKNSRG